MHMQAAHMFLCRTVLWDFDGLWKWLIAAMEAPVVAVASYAQNSQLQKVIAIRRQGIFYNHICLPDDAHALAQPMRDLTHNLMHAGHSSTAQTGIHMFCVDYAVSATAMSGIYKCVSAMKGPVPWDKCRSWEHSISAGYLTCKTNAHNSNCKPSCLFCAGSAYHQTRHA